MYNIPDVWKMVGEFPTRSLDPHRAFLADENNPIFVSFTAAGRTWLSFCIQRYFNKQVLYEIYEVSHHGTHYNGKTDPSDFVMLHTHDKELDEAQGGRPDLSIKRPNVIYLVRNPVDVVFSGITGRPMNGQYQSHNYDKETLINYTLRYKAHVNKWLHTENFTKKKTVIKYDALQYDFIREFAKIVSHIDNVKIKYDNRKNISFDCDDSDKLLERLIWLDNGFYRRIDMLGICGLEGIASRIKDHIVKDIKGEDNFFNVVAKEIVDPDGIGRPEIANKFDFSGRFVYEQQRNDFRNAYGRLIEDTMGDTYKLCI